MTAKLILAATIAAGSLLGSSAATAFAAGQAAVARPHAPAAAKACPSSDVIGGALAQASDALGGSRFQDAASILQPLAAKHCDPRVSLLLAAALDAQGDKAGSTAELERAHRVWPANDSLAASLARSYLTAGDTAKAAQALAHFHVTAKTPEQEMRMAAVVYLAAHQLQPAESAALAAYKAYPSVETLLLLANTLQMEGRYPDVNRLLGAQRTQYSGSPEFFVTLAESEFDASLYQPARDDLKRALALDPRLYQAHYLMGNVLARLGDADGAAAEYHTAIGLAPDHPRTYYQLALLLRSRQDQAGEQQALAQALAADAHYGPAQCEMGRMLLEDHHAAEAIAHLTTAIEDNPRLESAYFLLARAYSQLGEQDKSKEITQRLMAVRKENRPPRGGAMNDLPAAGDASQP